MTLEAVGVGVVVVNYGSAHLLRMNLVGLQRALGESRVQIFVVDNHSTEANRADVIDLCAQTDWVLLPQAENRGFGHGVNIGFDAAVRKGCDVLVALNPDARVTPEALDVLAGAVRADRESLTSPRIVDTAGAVYFDGSQLDLGSGRLARRASPYRGPVVEWLTGACFAIHAQAWKTVEGFDGDYFLYWEDVDLSYRATRAGLSLVVRSDVSAVHDEGGTHGSGGRAKSALYYRYNCRNRLLFAAKYLTVKDRLRWMALTPRESLAIYLRGGRRQLLASPGGAVAALRGSLEGLVICARSIVRSLVPGLVDRHAATVGSVE